MRPKSPRLAVRAIIVEDDRLLMVNAFPDGQSPLMCVPGGGVNVGTSLPDNLIREVFEETGLHVTVGAPCLLNEFHDPESQFHQVDVFFHCTLAVGSPRPTAWTDPEAIVTERRWLTAEALAQTPHKPDSLGDVAFGTGGISYDPLELLVR
ncbi:NUDIX domain-containing protein [uncultured Tateyamaria sp.]|uniref:NUDIX domain-containing protein n=1 Tax=Tateyamaria sp. 1078 TaxID=3417464 RepID=UPI00262E4694|nr:NUDIX domain-containing protein [uncultured Tateyamaria sp.]